MNLTKNWKTQAPIRLIFWGIWGLVFVPHLFFSSPILSQIKGEDSENISSQENQEIEEEIEESENESSSETTEERQEQELEHPVIRYQQADPEVLELEEEEEEEEMIERQETPSNP